MPAERRELAAGEEFALTHLSYRMNDDAESHRHSVEQCGYVVSGRFRLSIGDRRMELGAGDGYVVPARTVHAFEVIEPGDVVIVASLAQETEVGDGT